METGRFVIWITIASKTCSLGLAYIADTQHKYVHSKQYEKESTRSELAYKDYTTQLQQKYYYDRSISSMKRNIQRDENKNISVNR